MSTTALTVVNNVTALDIQRGGLGFNSKLFQLKPATIQLTQRMSRQEGAIPGKLRVKETGELFDEMHLVLLFEPVERRSCFEGEDFSPDNQICFSLDNVQPHSKAKVPQAMYCASCPKASWERYRQTGQRKDMPTCKNYWHNIVVDRVTQMPYYLDVRGASIRPYTAAMQNIARLMALMQSQGMTPNIFDISFKIKPIADPKNTYFMFGFSEFAPINNKEDKEKFGNLFLEFVNRRNQNLDDELQEKAETEGYIDGEIVTSGTPNTQLQDEITI